MFGFLRRRPQEPEPDERDYSRVAVPDPHQPEGKAPYVDAWVGYSDSRMLVTPSQLHTEGREPRQVPGDYPAQDSTPGTVEETLWRTEPSAVQNVREMAPDPRWAGFKRAAKRPQRAPTSGRWTNPFDWQLAHHLNGAHFSMADHIRTYPIGGMQPLISRRNTFRLMPPPHDINQTNVPANTAFDVNDMDMSSPVGSWRSPMARLR